MLAMDLKNEHIDFTRGKLDISQCPEVPHTLLEQWLNDASKDCKDYNAMVISTVDGKGLPSSRVVLLRHLDHRGVTFFTNYESRKGRELLERTACCLNFFWPELERQVRVEGVAQKIDESESDAYFAARPRLSQLGAWASRQSQVIGDRKELEERMQALTEQYDGKDIPRPPHWGGFLVQANAYEFWQGRAGRLHDRVVYTKKERDQWHKHRLSP